MQLSELIRLVAKRRKIKIQEAEDVITEFLECLTMCFEYGEDVGLRNFGKFEVRELSEVIRPNPRTGEPMVVSARKTVRFTAAPAVKKRTNTSKIP